MSGTEFATVVSLTTGGLAPVKFVSVVGRNTAKEHICCFKSAASLTGRAVCFGGGLRCGIRWHWRSVGWRPSFACAVGGKANRRTTRRHHKTATSPQKHCQSCRAHGQRERIWFCDDNFHGNTRQKVKKRRNVYSIYSFKMYAIAPMAISSLSHLCKLLARPQSTSFSSSSPAFSWEA